MTDRDELRDRLERIDGRSYKAYRDIKGRWELAGFTLVIDHVQGDPYASPTRVRALLTASAAAFPRESWSNGSRAVGLAALLARRFGREARERSRNRGTGKSGEIRIEALSQEVLPQTSMIIGGDGSVEARFTVGLPARGRRVRGHQGAELLLDDVPAVVARSLRAEAYDEEEVVEHATANEDADALRDALKERSLVAFVADGAILPRRSGVDDRPLDRGTVVPFESPQSLRVRIAVPNAGEVRGMGIPEGLTLVVGGGYHGKSTVLRAIERGVYNHHPGDGRERVVSEGGTVKVRAEDGRSVAGVDISPFIRNLPLEEDTGSFSTPNASGSTSQAANIMEALEAGATTLLVDEDTAATNFMIRDRRMQALVPRDREPITPFIDRVRHLHEEHGVSSILVLGGSGDYLDVADTVIAMNRYRPAEITAEARDVAAEWPTGRRPEAPGGMGPRPARVPQPDSLDPSRGRRRVSIKVRGTRTIQFGTETIDLSAVEQLVAWSQTRAISRALLYARERWMDGKRTLPEILDRVMEAVEEEGLDVLERYPFGDLARFRRFELAAALGRLRTLRVTS